MAEEVRTADLTGVLASFSLSANCAEELLKVIKRLEQSLNTTPEQALRRMYFNAAKKCYDDGQEGVEDLAEAKKSVEKFVHDYGGVGSDQAQVLVMINNEYRRFMSAWEEVTNLYVSMRRVAGQRVH